MQKKHLWKLNTHSWLQTLRKLGREGNFLSLIKDMYVKPQLAPYYTHWWNTESFPSEMRNKRSVPTFTTAIEQCSRNSS